MALVLGELSVVLTANPARFASAMSKAEKSLDKLLAKLSVLKAVAKNLDTTSGKMSGMAGAAKGLVAAAAAMGELKTASQGLEQVATRAKKLEGASGTLKGLAARMRDVGKASKDLDKASKSTSTLADKMGRLKSAGGDVRGIGTASLGFALAIGGTAAKMVALASNASEVEGRMQRIFGNLSDDVDAWAKRTADAVGRSRYAMRELAVSLGETLTPTGLASDAVFEMSTRLAELAVDATAARGGTEVENMEKFRDAVMGGGRALRDLGIKYDDAELQRFAYEQGLDRNVDSLTENEAMLLRYKFILSRTSTIQGEAADNASKLSGSWARMKGKLHDLAVTMGEKLAPVAANIIEKIEVLTDWFSKLDSSTQNLVGKVAVIALAVTAVGALMIPLGMVMGALGTIGTILATVVTPELLVGVVMVGALVAAFGAVRQAWQEFEEPIKDGLNWIVERLDDFLDRIDDTIQKLVDLGLAVAEAFAEKNPLKFAAALGKLALAIPGALADPLQLGKDQSQIPEGASNEERAAIVYDVAKDAMSIVANGVKEHVLAPLKEAFVSGLEGLAELIPPELKEKLAEWQKKMQELIDKLNAVGGPKPGGGSAEGEKAEATEAATKATKTWTASLYDAWRALTKWFNNLPGAVRGAAKVLGGAAMQGELGATVQGGIEGGQAGGPWGAVAGAIAGLLTTTKGFKDVLEVVNRTLGWFGKMLGELILEPLAPVIEGLLASIRPLLALVGPLLRVIPIFQILAVVVEAVAIVAKMLFDVFRVVALGILRAIRWVLKSLGKSTKKIDNAYDELKDMSFETAGSIDDLGDAASAAAEALINVPEGFKIAQYRWESMMADYTAHGPGGTAGPPGNLEDDVGMVEIDQSPNDPPPYAPPGYHWYWDGDEWQLWPNGVPDPEQMGMTGNGASSSGNGATSGSSGNAASSDPSDGKNVLYVENLYALDPEDAFDKLDRTAKRRNYIRRGNPNPTPAGMFGRKT